MDTVVRKIMNPDKTIAYEQTEYRPMVFNFSDTDIDSEIASYQKRIDDLMAKKASLQAMPVTTDLSQPMGGI